MALLKFPFSRSNPPGEAAPPADSVEALRRRARHRLIGAVALVLAAVIGFPLVFDTQPRPVSVDVPIVIPDRNKVAPLPPTTPAGGASAARTLPGATPSPAPTATPQPGKPASVSAQGSLDDHEVLVAQKKPEKPANPSVNGSSSASHSIAKPATAASVAKSPARDDGARARALLEGKDVPKASPTAAATPPASAGSARYIVQVGAFADAAKARETRLKVERAGMTTYTQVTETAEGKRIRVRVGPFTDRAEAEKAAARVRALGLPAALLTL
ncbi:MAG: SPOR domain-containing protein [Tibeticola sp.]